jgi:multidrug efflux pump subunit AcrB
MKISTFAVKNPQFTLVAFLCLAALGLLAFKTIPRAEDPYFPTPVFVAVAIYPGASPEQVEREVVDKLEEKFAELSDVKKLSARVVDGVAAITVEFRNGIDTARKEDELLRQVAATRGDLPAGVRSVEVTHAETTNVAILQLALVAPTAPWSEVEPVAKGLARRLEAVAGVKKVEHLGYPAQEARVDLDPAQLARRGLTISQLIGAITGGNASIPGGDVDLGSRRFTLQTTGAFRDNRDLADTVVGGAPGDQRSIVRLGDVAQVRLGDAPETYQVRLDGQRAALITVAMRNGENIFTVRDRLLAVVAEVQPTLPAGMTLVPAFDQSHNVAHRLGGLERDFIIAIVLVLITLVPLGPRASLVVMVSIPMSLAIGVALLSWLGFSLNQLSIVGFVIALGLLVDDSIVVAENITRWMRLGKSRTEAAIAATSQIGVAVLGCTATLIFAFLPLLFLPGNAGEFIRSLPVAVVVTILASLLVSITLIPFLASRVLKPEPEHGNVAFRVMARFIEGAYRPILARAMRRPKLTLAIATVLVASSVALIPRIGFSLFPKAGIPQVMVNVETPDGSSLAYTAGKVAEIERIVRAEPAVTSVLTSVGRGHPQVYYNVAPRQPSSTVADLFLQLDRYDLAATPAMLDRLRARLASVPGAEITIREFENGPPIEAPIAIRLLGDDLDRLRALAAEVSARLAAVPGTRDVRNPLAVARTDLAIDLDEGKAGLLGVQPVDVDRHLRLAAAGLTVGTIHRAAGDDVDLVLGLPGPAYHDLDVLDHVEIPTLTGAAVPLSQLATVGLRAEPRLIQHHNRSRAVTITAEIASGANAQAVSTAALAEMARQPLPAGYRWEPGGLFESQQESFAGLGPAIIIAIFGVLAILVLEFKSFASTLIVAAVIPLGAMGGLVALWLGGETLSFTASIGFIALVGIEVKNSLLLVDFTHQLHDEGMALDEAIRKAGEIRFFPILLTSLTAIGGLVPLVLEHSALYSPLAMVIIGGLVSSTLLSRLVTPVMSRLLLRPNPAAVGRLIEAPVDAPAAGN